MPQFEISTYYSQIFWLVTVFGLLYLIIYNFVSPFAEQIFKNRQTIIDNSLKEAELIAYETETIKEEYEASFKNILNIAENIKKETIEALNLSFAEKKGALSKELEKKSEESFEEINLFIKSFKLEQSESCLNLAGYIIEKITYKKPDLKLLSECYEKIK